MKLVELLAREMKKWPEDCTYGYCMQANGSTEVFFGSPARSVFLSELADDRETAKVTTAQWQAERDRHKGGDWKRHRGGKQPVADDVVVEYKLRNGYTDTWHARALSWSHAGGEGDVMKYRVISQPQAEEVGVKDTTIGTLSYKVEIDTTEATQAIDELAAKWDQIETPFKWRDEVTELNAYIEKYTRERDALIERLASEGFALIPPVVGVVSEFSGVQQIIPFEEWTDGDIVRCIDTGLSYADLTLGNEYTVVTRHGETGVIDDAGDHMCSCIDVGELEFVRRP